MKRSKAISRATQRIVTPTLPTNFNARLMERVAEQARRQRRTELVTGIAASIAITAMVVYAAVAMANIEMPKISFPHIEWSMFGSEEMAARMRMWGPIAVMLWAIFIADMFIRQHFRMKKLKKKE